MEYIRQARWEDLSRIAEIVIFNYRLFFYPIFRGDLFYFEELQVVSQMPAYGKMLDQIWVYDDGVVKGIIQVDQQEVKKLFVEPVLQGCGIGARMLTWAIKEKNVCSLWALEKNSRAIAFYQRHGFELTAKRKLEEGTSEYLVQMERK